MAEDVEAQDTLRDTIESAFDEHVTETGETRVEHAQPASQPASSAAEVVGDAAASSGEDRPRGADGKFLKKEEAAPQAASAQAAPAAAIPPAEVAHGLSRPSSWKKDFEERWGKLDKETAQYILQREGEYAKGVSTYKQEWDRAKPLLDAVTPHLSMFQQHGIDPAQQVSKYIEIHRGLAMGTSEQKLGVLMRIAQDYQIPLQSLFQQGQDGKVYFNPQVQPWQPPAQQAQQQQRQPADIDSVVEAKLAQRDAAQALQRFEQEAPQKFKHYDQVKETMARLLEAGFAQDYPDAYNRALRMPEHTSLFEADDKQRRATEEAERSRKAAETVAHARRQAVSIKSATPAAKGAQASGKKGLRAQIEDAFDEHTADRV